MAEPAAMLPRGDDAPALSGRLEAGAHFYPLRVFYEDTDAAGIVYYANYLKFAERARTEMMRLAGISHTDLLAAHGLAFVVRRCTVDFRSPAQLDDVIEVCTHIERLGGASIDALQRVMRDRQVLVEIALRLGVITRDGRAARLPAPLAEALRPFQHGHATEG